MRLASIADRRGLLALRSARQLRRLQLLTRAAKATLACSIRGNRGIERRGTEVRPQNVREIKLRVGELPQQEVGDPLFAASPNEKVGLGRVAHREIRRQHVGLE